ncbi:MAG TPA: GNAT family N-acetyltransferase [Candidatus Saccharimonas sp.]|nr:GNAT family N-acetyltransferase [Candidatus Saccharimonas sp.]
MDFQAFTLGADAKRLQQLVSCYRTVFAGPPWHEDWDPQRVAADLRAELARPGAHCLVAIDQPADEIVGFCWGYTVTPDEAAELLQLPNLVDTLQREFGSEPHLVYADDLGLLDSHRGRHAGAELYWRWLSHYVATGYTAVVLRTMTNPPTKVYPWFRRDGYQVLAQYNDPRGRVVMGSSLPVLPSRPAPQSYSASGYPALSSDWNDYQKGRYDRFSTGGA